jgi:hypothetical protein
VDDSSWEYGTLIVKDGMPVEVRKSDGTTQPIHPDQFLSLESFWAEMGNARWEAIEIPGTKDDYSILFKRPILPGSE